MNAATNACADTFETIGKPPAAGGAAVLDDPLELPRYTRWIAAADGGRLGESSLQLGGMHCAACAGQIEAALVAVPGVREARVAAASQRATVTWDPRRTRPSALFHAVRRAGYEAVPDAAAPARELRRREARVVLWRLFVAAFAAMQVMMLATPSYVAGAGELAPDLERLLNWGSWVLTLPVLAFSCGPFFRGAWRSLRTHRIGMDVPVALGIAITFVASSGAAFQPGGLFGSEVYFDSLTMFVAFLLGARTLEMRARHRAAEEMESSLARLPETAELVADDGTSHNVSVLRLQRGDRVRVALGQAFPADGDLLQGPTQCDESLLTGESLPVAKAPGDAVVAGSLNLGAPVLMRVLRAGPDTRLEGIVAMMRRAATERPALARLADRWAAPFLWIVLLLAAGGAAAWSFVDPSRAVWVAVSVLIVTCPCALSLAAPATLLAAARALARRGVMVQRLDAIEALARTDHVFFDKTGTLTSDLPALAGVSLTEAGRHRLQGGPPQALEVAAALAAWSRHPLSQALARAAQAAKAADMADADEASRAANRANPMDGAASARGEAGSGTGPGPAAAFTRFTEVPGLGVQAEDGAGAPWRLGAPGWAGSHAAPEPQGHVCLARDGEILASFEFEESLRPGAAEAVARLREAGVRVTLLSGDRTERAAALARRLGIADVVAGASPEAKLAAVAAAQAAGHRVAMVGDGINDAPVLARADVALAMGQGALVARAQAGAVLAAGRPGDVLVARRLARRAVRLVHQNLLWAAAYNATCVPLALVGWLPPWAAGLGMAASSLLVVGNALRVAR
ncbi:MAG: cation-translocating P-type ATPase [Rubrivivax sp.]|nr:cation-translocating P-type ATPase [Rubrivivax sp.]